MNANLKIIRMKHVAAKLGIAHSTLYNWLNPKSKYFKPDFPKPTRIGGVVGILEHKLDALILASTDHQ